jgi:hypothetical protein
VPDVDKDREGVPVEDTDGEPLRVEVTVGEGEPDPDVDADAVPDCVGVEDRVWDPGDGDPDGLDVPLLLRVGDPEAVKDPDWEGLVLAVGEGEGEMHPEVSTAFTVYSRRAPRVDTGGRSWDRAAEPTPLTRASYRAEVFRAPMNTGRDEGPVSASEYRTVPVVLSTRDRVRPSSTAVPTPLRNRRLRASRVPHAGSMGFSHRTGAPVAGTQMSRSPSPSALEATRNPHPRTGKRVMEAEGGEGCPAVQ